MPYLREEVQLVLVSEYTVLVIHLKIPKIILCNRVLLDIYYK